MCWYSTYYIFGAIGFVWIYFMTRYGRNCPEDCDDISAPEREFIKHEKKTRDKVPWLKILTSPALLAIWAAHAGTFWTIWLMTAEIPSYLTHVLKYSVFKDGQTVGDAYFMSWLCSFIMSGLTGYLIKSKILTLNVTRKICQSIASFLTALCLIILGFISDPHWVVFLLNVIFMSLTASFWGFMLNYNDITHNRGVVTEVGNFIGTVTTIIPAVLKHFIVSDQTDGLRWGIMFWITAIVAILSNTAFFFFSSGDIQEWDSDSALNGIEESRFLMKRTESMSKRYNNPASFEEKQQTKTTIDCEREKKSSSEDKGPTKSDDSSK
ncbi:hypothetical protein WA026_000253 [Henosepilachna vigintioctopunctata]|uniref:Inorganic phosphate cotransporter n=1 Tax=Henosepilachna vigintioctopunctata TaxID=420089 RepID=A0AAW1UXV5_9CUCU